MVSGALIAFLQWKLGSFFAKASDVTPLAGRVTAIEERLSKMPNHEDLRQLQERVGNVEKGVAVVDQKVSGLKDIMVAVSHQTTMLVQHHMNEKEG
nr:DUF2730 family protein [Neoroseomonas alba]